MKASHIRLCILLCCTLLAQKLLATGPNEESENVGNTEAKDEWEFEEITTDGSTLYYIYNLASHRFLSDGDSLTIEPTTLWTVNGQDIASIYGHHISLTSRNTGSVIKQNWVFDCTSEAQVAATSNVEEHEGYYLIGNKVNVSLIQQKIVYLTSDGSSLSASQEAGEQAKWLFVSLAQIDSHNPAAECPWTPQTLSEGRFLLYNKQSGLFVSAPNDDDADSPTRMSATYPTYFTLTLAEDSTAYNISSDFGHLGIPVTTSPASKTPTKVTASSNASDGWDLLFEGDEEGYTISVTKEWNYLLSRQTYTAYLAMTPMPKDASSGTLSYSTSASNVYGKWILVSPEEYELTSQAREEALARLQEAISKSEQVRNEVTDVPGLSKTILDAELTAAKAIISMEDSGSWTWISNRISVSTINSMANTLISTSNNFLSMADYYTACLAAISNIEKISSGTTLRALTSTARASLQIAASKEAMTTAMSVLRTGVTAYLQTINTFEDGKLFTGMLGNHSFDTGDLVQWYSLSVDLSSINLAELASSISKGDLGSLANAVSLNEWKDNTKAVRNEGEERKENVDGRYRLQSEQTIMQPLLGLPAGIYEFKASATCAPGLLNTDKIHTTALVIPAETVQQMFGDLTSGEGLSGIDLSKYIGTFLSEGLLNTRATVPQKADSLAEATVRFILNKGDIVILGINAGIAPYIGTALYNADNLQLTYLRSANGLMDMAKATLKEALDEKSEITANCTSGEPFSYDPHKTETYNSALASAKEKYDDENLSHLLTGIDLYDIDNLDEQLAHIFDEDATQLQNAWDDFIQKAFIAPKDGDQFNLLMKDDWLSISGNKWTGNALTITDEAEGYVMAFKTKPGESNFTQAVHFFTTEGDLSNELIASIITVNDTLYIAINEDGATLTDNKDKAQHLIVTPSYTVNGQVTISINKQLSLGTSQQSNALAAVAPSTLLKPTHSGLSIVPATEHAVSMEIPQYGIATLTLPFQASLPEGLQAFSVSETGGEDGIVLQLCEEDLLRPCIPYIIMGTEGVYHFSGISLATASTHQEGLLLGTFIPRTLTDGEYILEQTDGITAFAQQNANTATIDANQCCISALASSPILYLSDDVVVSIKSIISNAKQANTTYNLAGQKVGNKYNGIVVQKGKTILRK